MTKTSPRSRARLARFGLGAACVACSVAPSRTPLGGKYDAPASSQAAERRVPRPAESSPSPRPSEVTLEPAPAKPVAAAALEAKSLAAPDADTLVYRPLKAGDRIEAEVALGFDAELHGGPPGSADTKFVMTSRTRVAVEITKASALSLDALELTVTTLSMHSEFAGSTSDGKPEPPEVYDVTLGQSPSIRAHDGSKPDPEARAMLLVLVAPIVDFHAHWASSPTLDLKPGWSSMVKVTLPAFSDGHHETVQVGPFTARYAGQDSANDSVPFDVSLPVKYGADMGKLSIALAGKATLSKGSGRPIALELSGPFSAEGVRQIAMSFTGATKFSAKLSYP